MSNPSFFERNDFLLRRLHSLTGIVPIGVFLIAHLTTNSSVAWGALGLRGESPGLSWSQGGAHYFNKEVTWINEQVPHLWLIEVTLWVSLAFHSLFGLYIASTGRSNLAAYGFKANWRYTLQRSSGYVGILFIFYHVATLRWGWSFLVPGGTVWSYRAASSTLAMALRGGREGLTAAGVLISLWYLLGVSMLVFHFANGLWTAAITWGLTVSRAAQKRWGLACAGLGGALMVMAWSAVIGFAMMDPAKAAELERGVHASAPAADTPALNTGLSSAVKPAE